MNRLNGAFTVTSVLVLLVTIERFSFTGYWRYSLLEHICMGWAKAGTR